MIQNELQGFYAGVFFDKRLDKRACKFLKDMSKKGSSIINQCYSSHAESQGAYRLLNNDKCSIEGLISASYTNCKINSEPSNHLLCIQDTTDINYTSHIKGIGFSDIDLGPGGMDAGAVFFCHPTLVIDAESCQPLGFSSVELWNRSWDKKDKHERGYKNLPIEEKESYRWLKSVTTSELTLGDNKIKTFISDRESDIYQLFLLSDSNKHFLIRSTGLKRTDESQSIRNTVGQWKMDYSFELVIKSNNK